jgi:hypothetical protein
MATGLLEASGGAFGIICVQRGHATGDDSIHCALSDVAFWEGEATPPLPDFCNQNLIFFKIWTALSGKY